MSLDDKVEELAKKAKVMPELDLPPVPPIDAYADDPELQGLNDNSQGLLNPPPVLHERAYHGLLKDIVKISTRDSEASPVAVAANAITYFCALVGRVAYQNIGDATCHCRVYTLLAGRTGKARKGTSEYTVLRIFKEVERQLLGFEPLKRHEGGLSTGEGLGYALHDEIIDKDGKVIELGIDDKRLLIVEAEFGGAMAAAARDKNNLSATIRTAWDGKTISPLVKNSKWAATNPHIVITGHITAVELIDRMKEVDAFSGFLNRFVILHVMRPKLVPLPKRTDDAQIDRLAGLLADCAHFATGGNPQGNNHIEVTLSPDAIRYWCGIYKGLTKEAQGVSGALLVRTEIYCRMFAMVFALLDKSVLIEPVHIDAAMAWVDYWRASVDYIFETLAAKEEAKRLEGTASGVYEFIKLHPGCTRTDITNNFKNKLAAEEMAKALNYLLNASPPLIQQTELPRADGKQGRKVTKFKAL